MSFLKRFTTVLLPLMITAVIFYCGTLPENPTDPSNTAISVVIKTTDGKILTNSLADTVNKKFLIGAALRIPENFDSIRLSIAFKNDTILDTMFILSEKTKSYFDTLWIEQTLFSPGIYYATFKPYTNLNTNLSPATIDIMMVEADIMPENHKPSISVSGNTIFKPGDTCVLSITKTDPDTKQLLTTSVKGKPEGSLLKDNKFTWVIPPIFTGRDTILFIVSDNGYPQESDSQTVVITVTSTPHAPLISISGDSIVKPLETCRLTIHTSDKDSGQLLAVTMAGQPEGAVLVNDSLFTWTAPNVTSAKHTVTFTVTDNGIPPLSTSASVTIQVSADSDTQNKTYTVTYNGNGSTIGTVPVDTNKYISGTPVTVAAAGTLVKTGSTFTGWNTNAAGTGVARAAGTLYSIGAANDTLYAQWTTNPTYTVTYLGNGSTSGTAPVDSNKYISGASVTVATAGSLVKTGSTFTGWNTNAAGTGIARAAGSTYAIGAVNDTLYAQWTTNPTYSVSYIGNGNTSGSVPVDSNKYISGASVTVAAAGTLVKTGSTFTGWNTNAAGTGIARAAGSAYAISAANDTLYAQWTQNPTFTVTYVGNGSTSGSVPVDANRYLSGASVTVAAAGTLVKTGSTFAGWNTNAAGTGTTRVAGSAYAIGAANDTLYAQWKVKQYSVIYDDNDASGGTVPSDAIRHDSASTVTVMANTGSLVKTGYIFDGWNTAADGKGTTYTAGTGTFAITADITLFAKWKVKTYTLRYNGNENTGGDVPDDAVYDSNTTVTVAGNINGLTKKGYDFNGWNSKADGNGIIFAAASTLKIKSDTTLYAQWTVKKYKLTIETPVNGTINLSGVVSVDSNATTTITATASSGYKFKCWRVTAGSAIIADTAAASTSVNLTQGNATIKAVFGCLTFAKQLTIQGHDDLKIRDAIQTEDGGYLAIGSGGFLVKLNAIGDVVSTKTLNTFPDPWSIEKAHTGYILTGPISNSNNIDLLCITESGTELWGSGTFYDETNSSSTKGIKTRATTDNGYITCGENNFDFLLIKSDEKGRLSWKSSFNSSGLDEVRDCQQTSDGGYLIVGSSDQHGDVCVIKTNSSGEFVWKNTYDLQLSYGRTSANSINPTPDGDFIIAGYGGTTGEYGYILKISVEKGEVKMFCEFKNTYDMNTAIPVSGGYILTGTTNTLANGLREIFVAKINSTGTIISETTYGSSVSMWTNTGKSTKDGGCIITGTNNWIIKTDENGEVK